MVQGQGWKENLADKKGPTKEEESPWSAGSLDSHHSSPRDDGRWQSIHWRASLCLLYLLVEYCTLLYSCSSCSRMNHLPPAVWCVSLSVIDVAFRVFFRPNLGLTRLLLCAACAA